MVIIGILSVLLLVLIINFSSAIYYAYQSDALPFPVIIFSIVLIIANMVFWVITIKVQREKLNKKSTETTEIE